ncbi:MotA/TolQ/ExbB proton channel family protein [bacterium]|nr:MotA/TolQ/ExbB proton channel family protein [bacterium]
MRRESTRANWIALMVSVIVGAVFIALMTLFIGGGRAGDLLLGETSISVYPLTLQNIMHMFFFVGLGQLIVRWKSTMRENVFLEEMGFLPTDDKTVFTTDTEINEIKTRVEKAALKGTAFLPDLINVCINQYTKNKSVSDTLSVLNSNLELETHRLDLKYSMSKYIVWAIPTFGFIGTVLGIAQALGSLDIDKLTGAHKTEHFQILTSKLSLAFDTTLIALALSAILVFILHVVQKGEEEGVNNAGQYVLRNLINRIKSDSNLNGNQ